MSQLNPLVQSVGQLGTDENGKPRYAIRMSVTWQLSANPGAVISSTTLGVRQFRGLSMQFNPHNFAPAEIGAIKSIAFRETFLMSVSTATIDGSLIIFDSASGELIEIPSGFSNPEDTSFTQSQINICSGCISVGSNKGSIITFLKEQNGDAANVYGALDVVLYTFDRPNWITTSQGTFTNPD